MAHSKLKYPIGLLSENVPESIIGGLGFLLNLKIIVTFISYGNSLTPVEH
jgi:hypothetical protein